MPEVSLEDIKDKEGFVEAVELYRKAKAPRKISQAGGYIPVARSRQRPAGGGYLCFV